MSETTLSISFGKIWFLGLLTLVLLHSMKLIAGAGFFTHATMIGVFMDLIRDKFSVASEIS